MYLAVVGPTVEVAGVILKHSPFTMKKATVKMLKWLV
jgi:hypothetical protein